MTMTCVPNQKSFSLTVTIACKKMSCANEVTTEFDMQISHFVPPAAILTDGSWQTNSLPKLMNGV